MFVLEGNVYRYQDDRDDDYLKEWYVVRPKAVPKSSFPKVDSPRFSISTPDSGLSMKLERQIRGGTHAHPKESLLYCRKSKYKRDNVLEEEEFSCLSETTVSRKKTNRPRSRFTRNIDPSYSEEECKVIMKILSGLDKLYEMGFTTEQVQQIFLSNSKPSHVMIDKDFRILLTDFNIEVEMLPLAKVVFLLYLDHPEGIPFKMLDEYREEMISIYQKILGHELSEKESANINRLCDPMDNSINEKVSHIKQAFRAKLEVEGFSSDPYLISGARGTAKKISLNRTLVIQAVV